MNKPLSDESLERLLSDYGQIPPPTVFTYQPKSPAGFSMKRLAALSVAALLSLLILGLAAGMIAHFAADIPNLHHPNDSIPPALQNTTPTFPSPDRTTVSTTQG
ncbi:MAG: hypothetical protein IJW98_04960, partial [Clostridia bacterium]|nr:hypothetical protein [Clostridia bacterium]